MNYYDDLENIPTEDGEPVLEQRQLDMLQAMRGWLRATLRSGPYQREARVENNTLYTRLVGETEWQMIGYVNDEAVQRWNAIQNREDANG